MDAAQISTGASRDGENAATSYLAQAGNLDTVTITVIREPTVATAEVRGHAPRLVTGR